MKIGLLNIQNVNNYGANLISYSMEKEIELICGEHAEYSTINFRPDLAVSYKEWHSVFNSYIQYGFRGVKSEIIEKCKFHINKFKLLLNNISLYRDIKCVVKKILKKSNLEVENNIKDINILEDLRQQNFSKFRKENLHLSKKYDSQRISCHDYDVVVVGSDVVWKPQRLLTKEEKSAYFLLGGKRNYKRIAYAASIGVADEYILNRLKKKYYMAIKHFNYISMRERTATEYIQKILPNQAIANCIDPVFLRNDSEYKNLLKDATILNSEPYIYAYILGENEKAYAYVSKLAEIKGLSIVYHTNKEGVFRNGINSYGDGPIEFLNRISNAQYVITDSFHGTAFSIIFHKQFLTFTRGTMSVRLENFLRDINLSDRLVESISDVQYADKYINYTLVDSIITDWVEKSRNWLKEALLSREE